MYCFYAGTEFNYILLLYVFTIDLFIVEYFDDQIATNNTVNQCRLFWSVNIMEIFMSKSFRMIYMILLHCQR